jgi:hypothetical protein
MLDKTFQNKDDQGQMTEYPINKYPGTRLRWRSLWREVCSVCVSTGVGTWARGPST